MFDNEKFDELLQKTIPDACYEECCEIEEQMILEGEHRFSRKYEKKMRALLKRQGKCSQKGNSIKTKTSPKFRYLLVAILLALLSSMTVLAYEPAREAIKEFFFSIYDEYILFHSEDEQEIGELDLTEAVLLKPSYVPDGYELIDEHISTTNKNISLMWIDEKEEVLFYQQRTTQSGEMVLSSDGAMPQDVEIEGIHAKMVLEEDGMKSIFYEEKGYLFTISGFLEQEDLMNMLLSLEEID